MNLPVSSDVKKMVDARVKSGRYASPQDVLTAAMMTLEQHERFGVFSAGELDQLLIEGENSIKRYGTIDGEKAFLARRHRRHATKKHR